MATPAKHKAIRNLALSLAKVQIIRVLGGIIKPIGTTEYVEFDEIKYHHCREAMSNWRTPIKRQGITLDWKEKIRKKKEKIDVSIHCNSKLCGLMLANYSRRRINVNLRFLEGCPHPIDNPLLGNLMPIALIVAEQFAIAYGAIQVTISNPDRGLIEDYKKYGYELTAQDRDRERRKCPVRGKLLIKKIK